MHFKNFGNQFSSKTSEKYKNEKLSLIKNQITISFKLNFDITSSCLIELFSVMFVKIFSYQALYCLVIKPNRWNKNLRKSLKNNYSTIKSIKAKTGYNQVYAFFLLVFLSKRYKPFAYFAPALKLGCLAFFF